MNQKGYIHSLQSMGAVDGPGIRYVIFVQGCPLRCMYCHNPDTWTFRAGTECDADELIAKIIRCRPYFGDEGGVTVSGGEPLLQAEFLTELFTKLHKIGIRTCLDTSGHYMQNDEDAVRGLLKVTDLVICDIKFDSEESYTANAGGSLIQVRHFLDLVTEYGIVLWVRHVVVPGITDSEEEVLKVYDIAMTYPTLEKFELLPFRKLCMQKYEELGIGFRCADIPECTAERIKELNELTGQTVKPKN